MTVHWTNEASKSVVARRGRGPRPAGVAAMKRKDLLEAVALSAGEGPGPGHQAVSMVHRWHELRSALAVASDADYAAALEKARALWLHKPALLPRCALGYAFPDESDWAESATRDLLAEIKKQKGKIEPYEAGVALLGAVSVASLQTALAHATAAKRMLLRIPTDEAATMVDVTGDAAAEGLGALLAAASSNAHKVRYAAALALIESDDAARALAEALSSKVVLPIAKEYFARHPTVAKKALAKVAKESGTSASIAATLLKTL